MGIGKEQHLKKKTYQVTIPVLSDTKHQKSTQHNNPAQHRQQHNAPDLQHTHWQL